MSAYELRLRRLMEEVILELKEIGIYPSEAIIGIKENSRAKRRLGCCKKSVYRGKISYEIEISAMLKEKDDRQIKEIIHHELLHTCKGCLNHGQEWKALAAKVNDTYGYCIKTTADFSDSPGRKEEQYRYEIRCAQCGNTGYRMKKSKVVTHPENYRCSKCGGPLTVRAKSFWN